MGFSLFGQQGQGQLGAVLPQKVFVHAVLGGVAHGGGGFIQRRGQLGHGAAQQAADAVLNDKVGAGGMARHRRAARVHGLQQAHAEDLIRVQVHKSVAGMIINVHLLVGKLRDQTAAVQ